MKLTTISLNNSGGSDWLGQDDLEELKRLGWRLEFFSGGYKPTYPYSVERSLPEAEALAEFEGVTGFSTSEVGCECCGMPFYVSEEDVDAPEERPATFWAKPEVVDSWRRLLDDDDKLTPEAEGWLELGLGQ